VIKHFLSGIAVVVGVVVFHGDAETIDITFPDGITTFEKLSLRIEGHNGQKEKNDDDGDNDEKFLESKAVPASGHIYSIENG
jgi:hypothetical protein